MWRAVFVGTLTLWATAASPEAVRPTPPTEATLTLDQARAVARQALFSGQFELARKLAMGLIEADDTDPYAYGVLAAAHSRMNDPELARAAARLSYRYADTRGQKYGAARTAASIAFQQERPTVSQAWLRVASAHAESDRQTKALAQDYARVRAANPFRFTVNAALAPSDNVNNGTDNVLQVVNGVPTFGLYQGSSRALSGMVATFDTRLRYRLKASARSRTEANARLYTRRVSLSGDAKALAPASKSSDFASSYVEIGADHQFAFGAKGNAIALGGAIGASWSGGDRSYDFARLSTRRSLRLSAETRLTVHGMAERRWSTASSARDADVLTFGATLGHKLTGGDRVSFGVTVQTVSGEFTNADYKTGSLRASYTFGKQIGPAQITTGVTVGFSDYDSYVLLGPVEGGRQDTSVYGDVSLFFADYDFAGFAPTVQLRTGKRTSNVNRFDIRETTISLGIQSKF